MDTNQIRVAMPVDQGKLGVHFGHCPQFFVANIQGNVITSEETMDAPPHEPGKLPLWLREAGVTHVLAGGLGQKARSLLEENGIQVQTGVNSATPREIIARFMQDKLEIGENACDH